MRPWLCLALVATALAGSANSAPLEAYGRLPSIETASLSPDGKQLAYAVTDGEKRAVLVRDLQSGATTHGLKVGEHPIRSIQWAGTNHVIILTSSSGIIPLVAQAARQESWLAIDYNLTSKTQRPLNQKLSEGSGDALNVVYGQPQIRIIDGRPYAFTGGVLFVDGQGQLALFKVDLDHEDLTTVVNPGFRRTENFLIDARGEPLAETEYDPEHKQWTLKVWNGAWHVADRRDTPIERPALVGLGRDGASILIRQPGEPEASLRELSPDGATWGEPMRAPFMTIRDPLTDRFIGQIFQEGDDTRYEFFDAESQRIWKAVSAAYPGDRVTPVSASTDRRRFVLKVDSPTEGIAWALVDLNTRKGTWIGAEFDGLKSADISPVRPVAFKARDGLALAGYLTLPSGKAERSLPLVVTSPDDLGTRERPGFNWWTQALASRGYAVLQVNRRGSGGFGWDFQAAGFGELGRKMQTDLSDGVRYLAATGIVDAGRVCIAGARYGGYAALAGATLDPGVYRCAASLAGPSDLTSMVSAARASSGGGFARYLLRYAGPQEGLAGISPAIQAGKASIPVLLIHGKEDPQIPFAQSQRMADALRAANKPVELVTLAKEDGFFSRGETRLQMLKALVAFLEKNNPPD